MVPIASPAGRASRDKVLFVFLLLFFGSALLDGGFAYITRRNMTPAILEADEREYHDLAGEIIEGRYDVNPRRTIGFVLPLAGLRVAWGDQLFLIQLTLSLIFSLTTPLIYLLARRELANEQAGLTAGLGVMVWPLFVHFSATLYSETLALPVFAGYLLALPGRTCPENRRLWRLLGAGALLGLCMHIRPMYLLYSPLGTLVVWWRGPKGFRGLVRPVLLAAGTLAVVLPWSAFLSSREGSLVLLSSNGGESFAGGFNPELIRIDQGAPKKFVTPTGRETWIGPGKWLPPWATGYLTAEEETLPYTMQSDLLFERAREWIRGHPGAACYLAWRKLSYMWGIYPFWNGLSQTILGNVPLLCLLVLSAAAFVRLRRHWRELSIFWTLPLFVSIVAVLTVGSWRYREPGDLALIVLASALPWASRVARALAEGQAQAATGETQ
jgi:hypothetical protein